MQPSKVTDRVRKIAFYLAFFTVAIAAICMFSINVTRDMQITLIASVVGVFIGRALDWLSKRDQPKEKRKNGESRL